jgi:rRNA maturation endonuclease Nob1
MTSDVKYTRWTSNPGGINTKKEIISGKAEILIRGGHGVAHRQVNGGLVTPQGVVTEVSDEELAFLKKDETFATHLKHGFVKVLTPVAAKAAPEKVAKDMTAADASAPLTDKDFKKGGRATIPENAKIKEGRDVR